MTGASREGSSSTAAFAAPLRGKLVSIGGSAEVGKTLLLGHLSGFAVAEASDEKLLGDIARSPDALVLLVDARQGLDDVARRTLAVAATAGVHHLFLAVSKMDLVGWDGVRIEAVRAELATATGKFSFASTDVVPVCALSGENIVPGRPAPAGMDGATLQELIDRRLGEAVPIQFVARDPQPTDQFSAHVALLSEQPLLAGRDYDLCLEGYELPATVTAIKYRLDLDSLHRLPARTLQAGEVGICTIATQEALIVDASGETGGHFQLIDRLSGRLVAAGSINFALRRGMNVHWQTLTVGKPLRASLKRQGPCVVWLTGLSGSGKSTIANLVESRLAHQGHHTYLLDGDNVRHGLNKDLGFTAADRVENIRRVGEVARLFVDAGLIVLCSFISPFRAERQAVRSLLGESEFIEVFVTAPLEVCERRDPKGLYAKCRAGQLPNFTGIDSPYEAPEAADLVLDTTSAPASDLAQRVVDLLHARGLVRQAVVFADV